MASPAQPPPRGGGKRKGKAQYVPAKRGRRGDGAGPRQLEPGLQGVLITCNMNERKCVEEAYSLLGEYSDDLYGPEKVGPARAARRPWDGKAAAFRRVRARACGGAWPRSPRPSPCGWPRGGGGRKCRLLL